MRKKFKRSKGNASEEWKKRKFEGEFKERIILQQTFVLQKERIITRFKAISMYKKLVFLC